MLSVYGTIDLVDYQGRFYPVQSLMRRLSLEYLLELQYEAPRSGQEAWDIIVYRWPELAELIAYVVTPVEIIPVVARDITTADQP